MTISINSSTRNTVEGTDTVSVTHTVTSGADKLLVWVMWYDDSGASPTVSTVYTDNTDGEAPDTALSHDGDHEHELIFAGTRYVRTELWYYDSPQAGDHDIDVTLSETAGKALHVVAQDLTDAGAFGTNEGKDTGNSASPSVTFTTGDSDSLICAGIACQGDQGGFTEGTGTTETIDYTGNGNGTCITCHEDASEGSDTIGGTIASSTRWAMLAVEVLEDLGAPAGQPISLRATTVPHLRKWTPGFFLFMLWALSQNQPILYPPCHSREGGNPLPSVRHPLLPKAVP